MRLVCARSRSRRMLPQLMQGRREPRAARPAYCGAGSEPCRARPVPFCRYGFLLPPLTWPRTACIPCQAPGCGEAYSYACRVVPFYCR